MSDDAVDEIFEIFLGRGVNPYERRTELRVRRILTRERHRTALRKEAEIRDLRVREAAMREALVYARMAVEAVNAGEHLLDGFVRHEQPTDALLVKVDKALSGTGGHGRHERTADTTKKSAILDLKAKQADRMADLASGVNDQASWVAGINQAWRGWRR